MFDLAKIRSAWDMIVKKEKEKRKRLEEKESQKKKEKKREINKRRKEYLQICDRYERDIVEVMESLRKDWYGNGKVIKQNGSWVEGSLREYSLVIPKQIPPIYINSSWPEEDYATIFICIDWEESRLYFKIDLIFFEKSLLNFVTDSWKFNYLNPKYSRWTGYTTDLDIRRLKTLINEFFERVYSDLLKKEFKVK